MNGYTKTNSLLISSTWLCFVTLTGLTQVAPQQQAVKTKTQPKGYKLEDLPHLGEKEIDANENELKEVIRNYGPKSLMLLNLTKYYKKGFEENFSECVNSQEIRAERTRRWEDLMDFFDQQGGMRFFKTFWWPRFMKMPTAATVKSTLTPEHAILWDMEKLNKQYGVKDEKADAETIMELMKKLKP